MLEEKFGKVIRTFCKENGIKWYSPELRSLVRRLDIDLSTVKTEDRKFGVDFVRGDQDYQDLRRLQELFVSQSIDYIKSHPGLVEVIEKKRQELQSEWETDIMSPELGISFSIDRLEDSISQGSWSASSDSYLGISISGINIINVC